MTRHRRVAIAAAALLAIVPLSLFSACGPARSSTRQLASARHRIDGDRGFGSGPSSAETFYKMSRDLLSAASSCSDKRGRTDRHCAAIYAAGANAQAAAVSLYKCTAPFVESARTTWSNYLDQLDRFVRADNLDTPVLPRPPTC